MMSGYVDDADVPRTTTRRYRTVWSATGWRVAVNGCLTRPLRDRIEAERLAARLQTEADRLHGLRSGGRS